MDQNNFPLCFFHLTAFLLRNVSNGSTIFQKKGIAFQKTLISGKYFTNITVETLHRRFLLLIAGIYLKNNGETVPQWPIQRKISCWCILPEDIIEVIKSFINSLLLGVPFLYLQKTSENFIWKHHFTWRYNLI